ncbi:hypothetical protein [Hymenobacter metallicola]|nr:hypothetical protein [Hymenobacter metallicola]
MVEPASLAEVRALLQDQQLIVDQLVPGEARVTSATGSVPDWEMIKRTLLAAGYPAEHTTTEDD